MKPRLNGLPLILVVSGSASALSILHSLDSQLSPNSSARASISSAFSLYNAVGVRIPPRWSFSISFRPDTCTGDPEDPVVYESTDLPAWLTFDREYLTFYGVTPGESSQTQITLACHQGDAQVSQTFIVRVQAELHLQPEPLPVLVGSPRSRVSYDLQPFISTIFVEKTKLNSTQRDALSVRVGEETSWLSWDSATKTLQGVVPDSFIAIERPTNLTATLTFDLLSAKPATTSLVVTVEPYIFTNFQYPETSISGNFQLSLGQFLREPVDILNMTFQPPDTQAWMHLDRNDFLLSGTVPARSNYSKASLILSVQSPRTGRNATSTLQFKLNSIPAPHSFPVTRTTIALLVLAGVLGLALIVLTVYFVIMPRFKPRQVIKGSQTPSAEKDVHKAVPDEGFLRESSSGTADTLVQKSPVPQLESPVEPQSPWNGWLGLSKVMGLASHRGDSASPFANASSPQNPRQSASPSPQLNVLGIITSSETQSRTAAPWGPSVPKPPAGLTPQQTAEWVDNYVCKWVEEYTGEDPEGRKRRGKHSNGTSRTSQPSAGSSGASRWEGLPNSSDQPHAIASIMDPLHFRIATDSTSRNPDPSLLASLPYPSIRRSASCTNSSAVSSIVHSEISSVASWDSLDSWEMERRLHYEEPQRRGDFDPTKPARSTRPSFRSRGSQAKHSSEGQSFSAAANNHDRHTSEDVPNIVVTASTEGAAGSSGPLSRLAQEPNETASTSNGTSPDASEADNSSAFVLDGEDEVVFFPRPVGAETPGSGLARSPHLEGLSRFTRSSA
ncbi:hypothetical protein M407DRAFT_19980 [Tulasnella calospora MUT 4182]|uniref:Dystroglycan-type cadherin-like domain-containing protein n=1 Tax=Tulasnella calospora MUT 4182 TaxID=1051891 RepID=A0A0C3LB49_9AGAM|nr:hypothetical protein M407DRAFT_19980 [Tulasnella calospora MUT 4182]